MQQNSPAKIDLAPILINVRNTLSKPGRYKGRIVLKTDSDIKSEFTIYVRGFIYAG